MASTRSTGRPAPVPKDAAEGGKTRLLRVAMREFADQGFDGVTVRSIAAKAEVSPALVIHHFGSKDGLRDAVDSYFLDRSGAALERAILETHLLDPADAANYSRSWLTRYADEWPDFVAYLRRAILENSDWGQRLFRRYFDGVRHSLDRLDVAGRIRPGVDRLWLPLLYTFMLLGPLILEPHIRSMLGRSTYEPESWSRYQQALHELLWRGAGPRDDPPGR